MVMIALKARWQQRRGSAHFAIIFLLAACLHLWPLALSFDCIVLNTSNYNYILKNKYSTKTEKAISAVLCDNFGLVYLTRGWFICAQETRFPSKRVSELGSPHSVQPFTTHRRHIRWRLGASKIGLSGRGAESRRSLKKSRRRFLRAPRARHARRPGVGTTEHRAAAASPAHAACACATICDNEHTHKK